MLRRCPKRQCRLIFNMEIPGCDDADYEWDFYYGIVLESWEFNFTCKIFNNRGARDVTTVRWNEGSCDAQCHDLLLFNCVFKGEDFYNGDKKDLYANFIRDLFAVKNYTVNKKNYKVWNNMLEELNPILYKKIFSRDGNILEQKNKNYFFLYKMA